MPIEMTFPEALETKIISTEITMKSGWIVFAFVANNTLFYNFTIADSDQHRSMIRTESLFVHSLKTQEAEIVLAVPAKNLWLLDVATGAETPNSGVAETVIFFRTNCKFVNVIKTPLAI
jgi:hypothetical protein